MSYLYSFFIGYALGCISPSYILSAVKKKDLRKENTGNLGATNTMLTFGKKWGVFVMLFDILKAMIAVWLCGLIFKSAPYARLLGGIACAFGHIFPFYLKFRGGKGLATFGGLVLAYSPLTFLGLLLIGGALVFITNYSVALPFSASILFPVCVGFIEGGAWQPILMAALFGLVIILKHWSNFLKIRRGESEKAKAFIKNHVMK